MAKMAFAPLQWSTENFVDANANWIDYWVKTHGKTHFGTYKCSFHAAYVRHWYGILTMELQGRAIDAVRESDLGYILTQRIFCEDYMTHHPVPIPTPFDSLYQKFYIPEKEPILSTTLLISILLKLLWRAWSTCQCAMGFLMTTTAINERRSHLCSAVHFMWNIII